MKLMILFIFWNLLHAEPVEENWYHPKATTSWQWQLNGTLNLGYNVDLYDVDLFDTSKKTIRLLHKDGKKVICYFSAGSYEDWREDADRFAENVKGMQMDGWDELWLDIRDDTLKTIMRHRMQLAKEKGCDGVEADNVDAYVNKSGFPLQAQEQLAYNKFLAKEAHTRGLCIGLKNDLNQVEQLVEYFDFAVNEQCNEYNECEKLKPFINADKAVLNAEYIDDSRYKTQDAKDALCKKMKKQKISTLLLPYALDDSFRYSCD